MNISCIAFDFDGTLIRSNRIKRTRLYDTVADIPLAAEILEQDISTPPIVTAFGALINHITGGHIEGAGTAKTFQPMNVNFGIMPPLEVKKIAIDGKMRKIKKKDRKPLKSKRALEALENWLNEAE